jgi:glycosyltransferase involved in cell wall biosynthesis
MPRGSGWPRVSIVTPSYNQEQFIEETMRSVLLQNYPNLEYIIIDGGSTDGSVDIIRKYEPWLTYWVSEPDDGQADAIKRGFERASGDILAWLNSDDTYEPGAIEAVVEHFRANPGARLVYGEGWYMDSSGNRLRPCRFVRSTFPDNYIYNKDPILQQAAFWRRELWQDVGPLNASLNWVFDWDWFIRAHRTKRFHYLPGFLASYRVHPDAKTRTDDVKRRLEHAWITRTYGGWWHPNYLVQRARILAHRTEATTEAWPRWLASPVQALAGTPQWVAERLFYGMYTR